MPMGSSTVMYNCCNTYKSCNDPMSGLESIAASATNYEVGYINSPVLLQPQQLSYTTTTYKAAAAPTPDYHAEPQPVAFLNLDRPRTMFIAQAAEISEFVKEAFLVTTGRQLPEIITITIATRQILQQMQPQFLRPGVVGLSIGSTSEVFAVSGSLDEVMLTLGHEIGHVLTPQLPDGHKEETKAFAFEMAWAQSIFHNNIAGLRSSINAAAIAMKPAKNGLHDLAFEFVRAATILKGKQPLEIHAELTGTATAAGIIPVSYTPLANSSPHISYSGYRNKSNVQNVPWMTNFTWADLGTGVYGMYIPLTASIFMNDRLLRTDLEQFHKTLGHEYVLHHVMQLPDGYVAKVMEEQIFWTKDEKEEYKP